jgi:hypothetical protein
MSDTAAQEVAEGLRGIHFVVEVVFTATAFDSSFTLLKAEHGEELIP